MPIFKPIDPEQNWPEEWKRFFEPGEIHIWKAWLGGEGGRLDEDYGLLSSIEKARADRLRVEAAHKKFIRAHAIFRHMLGKYLGQAPDKIAIEAAPGGKPFLPGESLNDGGVIQFNLAHSGDWMLLSISRDLESGVDLEFMDPKVEIEQISTHFFSGKDLTWLDSQPVEQKAAAFFRMWTCKEAVLKADGGGIKLGLGDVRIEFEESGESALGFIADDRHAGRAWLIRLFEASPGYTAALAFDSSASAANGSELKFFQWMG